MKLKLLLLCCCFMTTLLFAQETNESQLRQQKIEKVEKQIEKFIYNNQDKYFLNKQVEKHLENLDDTNPKSDYFQLSKNEKIKYKNELKHHFLRLQYFKLNPDDLKKYKAPTVNGMLPFCNTNGGFEAGDFSGFDRFMRGSYNYMGSPPVISGAECDRITATTSSITFTPSNVGSEFTIVTPGADLNTNNGLNRVFNGNFAARINNTSTGAWANKLEKDFTLQQTGDFNIDFMLATVAEFPDHDNDNPFIEARVVDASGNELDSFCFVVNPNNNPFFNIINRPGDDPILWSNWDCKRLRVSGTQGQVLTLEIIVTDCAAGAHWGYAYVDDICMTTCDSSNTQQGSIEMPEIEPCTPMPFQYCVTYDPPYIPDNPNTKFNEYEEGVLSTATLNIIQNGNIMNSITSFTHNPSTNEVCFIINTNAFNFPSIGTSYDFGVNLDFTLNGQTVNVTEQQIVPGQNNDYDTSMQAVNSDFLLYNTTTSPVQLRATNFAAGPSGTIHEWYVLEEDQNGNLIPKIGIATGTSLTDVLLQSTLTSSSYYHVIHRVISDCGESCTVHTFYNDSSRLSTLSAEIDCCVIYEYDWPYSNGTKYTISGGIIDSSFTSSINSNGLINATATNNYSNDPNVEQTWVLYATPDISLPNPTLTQVHTDTGDTYTYQVSNTSLDYYLVHTVKVNGCDIISCSAHELRNFAGRSVNGMMSNIDCTEICSTLDAPENLVRQVNNPNSVTIAWDPVPNAAYYEISTEVRQHPQPCCDSEISIIPITTTNTSYTINAFGYGASNCSRIRVRAICGNGTKSVTSNNICIGKGTPYLSTKPAGFDVIVYPNPTKNYFNLEFDSKENINIEVAVYNYQGVKVNTKSTTLYENQKSKFNWSGDSLRPGLYFIIIESESETKKLKLVVE